MRNDKKRVKIHKKKSFGGTMIFFEDGGRELLKGRIWIRFHCSILLFTGTRIIFF